MQTKELQMKKSLLAALALSGVALFGHHSAFAQDSNTNAGATQGAQIDQDIDLLRKDIRSQKKQLIAANVPLTDAEVLARLRPVHGRTRRHQQRQIPAHQGIRAGLQHHDRRAG
jgi:hypothetical protein